MSNPKTTNKYANAHWLAVDASCDGRPHDNHLHVLHTSRLRQLLYYNGQLRNGLAGAIWQVLSSTRSVKLLRKNKLPGVTGSEP
ncbi:MAG: hypothetical protein CMJ75_12440 [Planctomycetaceae bacterium]|nr:hypothetical protein [Planctomycetaceae bacterium]